MGSAFAHFITNAIMCLVLLNRNPEFVRGFITVNEKFITYISSSTNRDFLWVSVPKKAEVEKPTAFGQKESVVPLRYCNGTHSRSRFGEF